MRTAKLTLIVLACAAAFPAVLFAQIDNPEKRADEIFSRWLLQQHNAHSGEPSTAIFWQQFLEREPRFWRGNEEIWAHANRAGREPTRAERDLRPEPHAPEPTVTPEPVSLLLFGTGLAGLAALRRKRQRHHLDG